jgi:hypothetical protein
LVPLHGSHFSYLRVREGKSKAARRIAPLTDPAATMLKARLKA